MQKKYRLRKNWQFQNIINSKKQYISKDLIFYFQKNSSNIKIGISISKKFTNAFNRNRYRRQTRAAIDIIKPWELKYDVVIILRKSFLTLSFEEKTNVLSKMFERLKNGIK